MLASTGFVVKYTFPAVGKGNTALLDAWTASKTDFMQTDSGDHEAFVSYLRARGLR